MEHKKVYIVLTQTYTSVARVIKKITHDQYSHVSISFDKKCTTMYSFGRKYINFPMLGIFKEENINKGLFVRNKNSLMAIYEIDVTTYQYKRIKQKIKDIQENNKGYNIIGLFLAKFKIKLNRKKYYCSEFVFEVLSGKNINILNKEKQLFKPEDIIKDQPFNKVFEGKISEYKCIGEEV